MMWCEKILTSEDGMKDKGGWQVVDAVFLVQKVFTLKILKRVQSTEGSSDPDSCFFRFIDGQLFDQAPSRGEIPDAEGVSCVWQRTLSLVRGSVGFLVPQKVSNRVPLMAAASREDLGACKEGMVAGTPAEIHTMVCTTALMTAATVCPPSAVPYNSNEGAGAFMERERDRGHACKCMHAILSLVPV
jgi:hypothetical protein